MDDYKPIWACSQWGNWEHDWLNCFDCLEGYESYLEVGPPETIETIWGEMIVGGKS
jgi:hypothetical protein